VPEVDLSEVLAFETSKSGAQPCPVKKAREQLKPKDRVLLDAACTRPQTGDGGLSNMALEKWLGSKGHRVSWQAIRNHRARPQICSCHHA
jgi:hypothetical protein